METKGIDLTQCNNCRFRAKVDGKEVEGRIAVDGDYLRFFYDNGDMYSIHIPCYQEHGINYFDDFELVPRDPETYRDWQEGDTIEYSDNYSTGRIIFRGGVFVAADIEGTCICYSCDELFNEGYRLVLTDIEQKIIEERKKYEPQDGDICYAETKSGIPKFIIIYNHRDWSLEYGVKSAKWRLVEDFSWLYSTIRPATDEEKKRLFDAMAKEGKRWNAEKKVVEDIPKPYEFKKGEPVLVRDVPEGKWLLSAFAGYNQIDYRPFCASNGTDPIHFLYCLPYNEKTMHLLGTAEDYKEE